jgi:hypothetical protein
VRTLRSPPGGDLTPFLKVAHERGAGGEDLERDLLGPALECGGVPGLAEGVTTDAAGEFRLCGIGRERLVVARIDGPTIASGEICLLTRAGPPALLPRFAGAAMGGTTRGESYYAASFAHVAPRARPVAGVIRDRDSGEPLAGVRVRSLKDPALEATTDAQGRYRLLGLAAGPGHLLAALPPEETPYLFAVKKVVGAPGSDHPAAPTGPVALDFALKRGVFVRGRVTDRATGKPVQARLEYFALVDENTAVKEAPDFRAPFFTHPCSRRTAPDGSFRLAVLPGPGLVAAAGRGHYLRVHEHTRPVPMLDFPPTAPSAVWPSKYHALSRINPPARTDGDARCDLVLEPGDTFTGTVVGPDGKPLSGWRAYNLGRLPDTWDPKPSACASFTVRAFNPSRPRPVLFVHEGRRLGARLVPPGGGPEPLTVKLEPAATLTGRLIDAGGLPRAGASLPVVWSDKHFDVSFPHLPAGARSDALGRFRVEGLVPGLRYSLRGARGSFSAGPGETKDLGDLSPDVEVGAPGRP